MWSQQVFRVAAATATAAGGCFAAVAGTENGSKWWVLAAESKTKCIPSYDPFSPDFVGASKWDFNWDHRGDGKALGDADGVMQDVAEKRRPTRNLILIRHGQYFTHPKHESSGSLTELGRLQAAATGRRLAEYLQSRSYKLSAIRRSDMPRALETAEIIRAELVRLSVDGVSMDAPDPMLRECAPHPPSPSSRSRFRPALDYFADAAVAEAAFRRLFARADVDQGVTRKAE